MDVNHVYSAAGEYTVKLTVTDAYGNQAEASCQIVVIDMAEENNGYTRLEIEVCDTTTGKALPGTELLISNEEAGFEETLKTMANGKLTCIVPDGSYKLIAHTEGYISRTIQLEAEGGTEVCRIPMTTGSIMTGTLTAKEMTYDEIIAAGIDPDAEGNQHVYKFETKFTFVVGLEEYEIPYTVFKNEKGKILGSSTGGSGGLGGSGGGGFSNFGGFSIGLFPITENFVLVIYGEAKWLKEMYNVELVVLNQSNVEELQDVRAKLIIPDGLSLADMTYGSQKSEHELGTVGCGQSAKTNWYVRGDEAGEYNLTAEVSAALTYGEVIHQKYTTEKPIRVYAGEALKLTITADDLAKRGEPYTVKYRLENVSDKSLYGLSFGLTASEQYKVIGFGDNNGIVPTESCDFGDAFTRRVDELAPEYNDLVHFPSGIY